MRSDHLSKMTSLFCALGHDKQPLSQELAVEQAHQWLLKDCEVLMPILQIYHMHTAEGK